MIHIKISFTNTKDLAVLDRLIVVAGFTATAKVALANGEPVGRRLQLKHHLLVLVGLPHGQRLVAGDVDLLRVHRLGRLAAHGAPLLRERVVAHQVGVRAALRGVVLEVRGCRRLGRRGVDGGQSAVAGRDGSAALQLQRRRSSRRQRRGSRC